LSAEAIPFEEKVERHFEKNIKDYIQYVDIIFIYDFLCYCESDIIVNGCKFCVTCKKISMGECVL